MSIYPTRTAAHLAISGVVLFAVGIAVREPAVVAWGGAMLVAIALARAVTLVSVMRIRAAGFEMLWTGSGRVAKLRCGQEVVLEAEVRNRDTLAARYDRLRVMASPALQTRVEPLAGEVHATGSVKLAVHVRALRVGYHGIYGLALEVRGAPGLFEVPLTFANPYGIEVAPRALARPRGLPHGGRSRTLAMAGKTGRQRGDGTDLRELREHLPGDSFRRIAWRASARRGKLVVKEFEREERDVVGIVLDASVELWSGPIGGAPLDRAIELCATLATHHLGRGDLVALRVVAGRELASVAADHGRPQLARIAAALSEATGVLDADRCGWDESDLAAQVTEHLRPLDPRGVSDLRRGRLDKLVKRASAMRANAPFDRPAPFGRSARDSRLRRYAACFGMFVPGRLEPDRGGALERRGTIAVMSDALDGLANEKKPRMSVVHVIAPPPTEAEADGTLQRALRKLRARRVGVRWTSAPIVPQLLSDILRKQREEEVPPAPGTEQTPPPAYQEHPDERLLPAVERAVVTRALVAQRRGERLLRKMGVKVVRIARGSHSHVVRPNETDDDGGGTNEKVA